MVEGYPPPEEAEDVTRLFLSNADVPVATAVVAPAVVDEFAVAAITPSGVVARLLEARERLSDDDFRSTYVVSGQWGALEREKEWYARLELSVMAPEETQLILLFSISRSRTALEAVARGLTLYVIDAGQELRLGDASKRGLPVYEGGSPALAKALTESARS